MSGARRYLITGGTSGIGAAVAAHLTAVGHAVWVTGTSEAGTREAAGRVAGASVADVTDPDSTHAAFAEAVAALGGLDGAFLNAGIDGEGLPAQELSPTAFARVLAVNTVGVLTSAQAAFRHLERPGQIVVNASVNALRAETHFADYNASKAAALSIAHTLALEWGPLGLSVVAVCPGYFRSRMTAPYLDDPAIAAELVSHIPTGRFGEPEDIGALLELLLGPSASYLNGSTVSIDGGRSL
ncbi:MAG: SDR family oxidoreductase [Cellulomonadaceae bacterium]|nr:SDR family oxidoreductase [Cellulomonadaceae bacterium]